MLQKPPNRCLNPRILVHSPLTEAQSNHDELLLGVCAFVGDLVMYGHGGAESRHVSASTIADWGQTPKKLGRSSGAREGCKSLTNF
jgi:hypothetical protein